MPKSTKFVIRLAAFAMFIVCGLSAIGLIPIDNSKTNVTLILAVLSLIAVFKPDALPAVVRRILKMWQGGTSTVSKKSTPEPPEGREKPGPPTDKEEES